MVIQREVHVALPATETFSRVVGDDYDFRFELEVIRVRRLTSGAMVLGTRYEVHRRFFGLPAVSVEEVVQLQPPHRIGLGGAFMGMRVVGAFSFHPEVGGTRVVASFEMPSTGIGALMAKLATPVLGQQMAKNIRALERGLSSPPAN